jgi:hypothetical protein
MAGYHLIVRPPGGWGRHHRGREFLLPGRRRSHDSLPTRQGVGGGADDPFALNHRQDAAVHSLCALSVVIPCSPSTWRELRCTRCAYKKLTSKRRGMPPGPDRDLVVAQAERAVRWPEVIRDIICFVVVGAVLISVFGEWPTFRGRK